MSEKTIKNLKHIPKIGSFPMYPNGASIPLENIVFNEISGEYLLRKYYESGYEKNVHLSKDELDILIEYCIYKANSPIYKMMASLWKGKKMENWIKESFKLNTQKDVHKWAFKSLNFGVDIL